MWLDRLEAWLVDHRHVVVFVVPLVGVTGLALRANFDMPLLDALATYPPLLIAANLVMALPLILGLRAVFGPRAGLGLLMLALFAYLIESIGVETGWPYGEFSYALGLEPLVFDRVPVALPIFWLPMIVNARLLALGLIGGPSGEASEAGKAPAGTGSHTRRLRVWLSATLLLVLLDGVLDPGAVGLGFWAWDEPGAYYGVPWINFGGWLLSGAIAQAILGWSVSDQGLRASLARRPWAFDTLRAFLVFWGAVNGFLGQWLPAGIALVLWLLLDRLTGKFAH